MFDSGEDYQLGFARVIILADTVVWATATGLVYFTNSSYYYTFAGIIADGDGARYIWFVLVQINESTGKNILP